MLIFLLQDDNERRYAIDTFWLENINFKKKIDCLAFSSLFEVRETANSLYSLALEYNLGDKVKNEFIEKIKFVNYLLENLGHGGHSIALQRLKDKFGGKRGMSAKNKKEADRIIRESLRGSPAIPQQPQQFFPPVPMHFPMNPFGAPQFPMGPPQQSFPVRGVNGPCFICQQLGHVARNCPNNQNNRGGTQFRRGGSGGRGNSGRKFNGRKKN